VAPQKHSLKLDVRAEHMELVHSCQSKETHGAARGAGMAGQAGVGRSGTCLSYSPVTAPHLPRTEILAKSPA
jgi:hypothetical protein